MSFAKIVQNRKLNPYYLGNPKIKRDNVIQEWTEETLSEFMICSENPIYFIEKYVTINTLDRGPQLFDLYEDDFKKLYYFDLDSMETIEMVS